MKPRPADPTTPFRRCAVYTRKSTSSGLDQAFNSLDAQREACEAYIKSQAHLGWVLLPERYDDGGFTGASLERPAFQTLLQDVAAERIDVVVVYKVDRLSRSLLDFARVMERFNAKGTAFVSVTQNFSTADAMGRLTLNMLMSFAEFEREMISERTRDKIAAARRKGKWTGGIVPMGYRVIDRRLVVHEPEAAQVREIFQCYLARGSALAVAQWLNDSEVPLPTQRVARPRPWTKDLVLRILRMRIYLGEIRSGGVQYPGEHEALIDPITFGRVQQAIDPKVRTLHKISRNHQYLARGTLKCGGCGSVMTTSTTRRGGREYRYYCCVRRGKQGAKACSTRQVPAEAIEGFVVERLQEAIRIGRISPVEVQARLGTLLAKRGDIQAQLRMQTEASKHHPGGIVPNSAELEREVGALDSAIEETAWLAETLESFEQRWGDLTPQNRQRLVSSLVEEVAVDERAGHVTVRLVNLHRASEAIHA